MLKSYNHNFTDQIQLQWSGTNSIQRNQTNKQRTREIFKYIITSSRSAHFLDDMPFLYPCLIPPLVDCDETIDMIGAIESKNSSNDILELGVNNSEA